MTAPAWVAPVAGYNGNAGSVNQFLAAHGAVYVYPAGVTPENGGGNGLYQSTAGQWLAQQVTVPASGPVLLQLNTVGGSPVLPLIPPLQVNAYTAGAVPSGSPLASVSLACGYVYQAPFWVPVQLPVSLAGRSCWIATAAAGSGSHYYTWQQSVSGTGAAASSDGVTWTAQAYGLAWAVTGAASSGQLQQIIEDSGARITTLTYNPAGQVTGIAEYTAAQDGSYFGVSRTVAYNGSLPAGVS